MLATLLSALLDEESGGIGIILILLGSLVTFVFQVWMCVDAVRRREYFWAVIIWVGSLFATLLYFFLVYRGGGGATALTQGFEFPGAGRRARIRELEAQIHHLDKPHHHLQLGDIYFSQGKLPKAEACYRAALERDGDDPDIRAHLGQCLLRLGRPAEARPLLEGVIAQDPRHDYSHTLMALAETLNALGEPDAALFRWQQVLERNSYARARLQYGELLLARGNKEEARQNLEDLISDDAHSPGFQRKRDRVWIRRARSLLGTIR